MSPLTAAQIRQSFLDFFREKGHAMVPSASLVPENDPTLLFTGAGMNQFKDLFLGRGEMPYTRAASSQKCFRTGDLDQVGRTTYHHTFFEMLGNFSFGDYFKKDAIRWAWEYLTEVMGIPASRLTATVYEEDDEAYDIWKDEVRLPEERITRLGAKSNFWPSDAPVHGPNGVCGPCSEIFFDYGEELACGPDCLREDCDCPRFSEVWNLVFTQFDRVGVNMLEPLPQKNIDTGMGFERLVAVLHGHVSTFETPLFRPIIDDVARLAGIAYEFDALHGVPMRRIADHVRAAVFCLVDGVKPGRDGRAFVLRRVIRRAVRDGIGLGLDRPFLAELAPRVAELMGDAYPAVADGLDDVRRHLTREEEKFRSTYAQGVNALENAVEELVASGGTVLSGEVAFRLHDERGFPVDLTDDYLREQGLSFDRAGFEKAMAARRTESQRRSGLQTDIFSLGPLAEISAISGDTRFSGHERIEDEGIVVGLVRDDRTVEVVSEGERVTLVSDRSPFYAESGGQIGDTGTIEGPGGRMEVENTLLSDGLISMLGRVVEGAIREGERVRLRVDAERRDAIRRNHTATHLLHSALRKRLGDHVRQAGSLVAPDRLRFDFHHEDSLSPGQWEAVEADVNREILANTALETVEMPYEDARATGAMALFGEKYEDRVRVVSIGEYSSELCGGTHCRATGEIGSFRIVSDTNIGAGLRRIEALTGAGNLAQTSRERDILRDLVFLLKARPHELPRRVEALRAELKDLRTKLDLALATSSAEGPGIFTEVLPNGVEVTVQNFEGPYEAKHLLCGADRMRNRGGRCAGLLYTESPEGLLLVVVATPELVKAGFHAGHTVRELADAMGGGGGGRPDLGQGKGRDAAALDQGIELLKKRAGVLPAG